MTRRGQILRTLWAILLLALILRVGFALVFPSFTADAGEYETLAKNLLAGHGFSEAPVPPFTPTVIREVFYPVLIAGVYALTGESRLAIYFVQALISTATIYLMYRIAVWFFDERIGLLAALLAALYLPLIVYVADLLTETTYIFLIVLGTYCFIRSQNRVGKWLIAAGVAFGVGALTRSDALFYPIALSVYAIAFTHSRYAAVKAGSAVILVVLVVIAPWMFRNYSLTGRPFLRDSAMVFAALSIGTGRRFSDPGYSTAFRYPGGMPPEVRRAHEQLVVDTYLADVTNNPAGYLRTRATQLARMWTYGSSGLPVAKGDLGDLPAQGDWGQFGLRLGLFLVFGPLVLIFALAGAVIGVRRNAASSILVVYPIYITLICLPLYADYRYSLSGQILLVPFEALAVVALVRKVRGMLPASEPRSA